LCDDDNITPNDEENEEECINESAYLPITAAVLGFGDISKSFEKYRGK
jgi:hypothetical protein